MKQQQLENRVQEIFEQQGFEVEETGGRIIATQGDMEKKIQVFSSAEHEVENVRELIEQDCLVFVDEGLEELGDTENVSVIRKEDRKEYDLPSYELIGDIAVLNELPEKYEQEEVVEGILEHHPRVKTILLKTEPLSGEFRLGEYEKLYGSETETTHKEFGCRYRVDPTKAYFSERLATERKRVVDQIEEGERVLVIGAGVGPYAILAARKARPEKVVAIEKNPEAAEYLRENIELNNVEDIVEAIEAGALEVMEDLGKFDRIIIATPEFPEKFLRSALEHTLKGGIIHYYGFTGDLSKLEEAPEDVNSNAEALRKNRCGEIGPSSERICIDLLLR